VLVTVASTVVLELVVVVVVEDVLVVEVVVVVDNAPVTVTKMTVPVQPWANGES